MLAPLEINLQNYEGASALIYAVMFGPVNIAKRLLELGADASLIDSKGHTAVTYASQKGLQELEALMAVE
ncbi:MAG: ankyrin repeat domain-containing protein [Bacteroidota bacterium]